MGASNTRIKMLPARDLEAADMVNWPLALPKDENNANFLAHKRYAPRMAIAAENGLSQHARAIDVISFTIVPA